MSKFKIGDRVWHKDRDEIGKIVGYSDCSWWSVALPSGTFSVHESRLSHEPQAVAGPAVEASKIAENKYARELYSLDGERVMVDVYRVLDAFKVTDPAIQHAIKKLLMPGERGAKSAVQDLEEAAFSIRQAIDLAKQKGGAS